MYLGGVKPWLTQLSLPNIRNDILKLNSIENSVLFKQVFEVGTRLSGQILSLTKLLGSIQEKGNTNTIKRYLNLLQEAELLASLRKYSRKLVVRKESIPQIQCF